ncbi:MAG TPA: aminopeptidase N, partial [Alphaproteobacteria bacterium]
MTEPRRQPVLLADYRPPAYRIARVELDIDLDEAETRVRSRLEVARASKDAVPLVLDGEDLALDSVAIDGRRLAPSAYQVDDTTLTLPALDRAVVEIETACRPRDNTRLEGLYVSNGT